MWPDISFNSYLLRCCLFRQCVLDHLNWDFLIFATIEKFFISLLCHLTMIIMGGFFILSTNIRLTKILGKKWCRKSRFFSDTIFIQMCQHFCQSNICWQNKKSIVDSNVTVSWEPSQLFIILWNIILHKPTGKLCQQKKGHFAFWNELHKDLIWSYSILRST